MSFQKLSYFIIAAIMFFSTKAMAGENIIYEVNGHLYEGYYAPANDDAPLILLLHDWDGLTDYEMRRADMLNELGYSVFAADLFGAGIRPEKIEDRRQHTGELYQNRMKLRAIINGAIAKVSELGGDVSNMVAMGYCFGGAAVLELARSGADLKGFVTFHGGLSTPEGQDHANIKGKILVLHGTADTAISMDDFAGLAKELESAGVAHEMITYSGAPHAFTVFDSNRYDEVADKASWARFLSFIEEVAQ